VTARLGAGVKVVNGEVDLLVVEVVLEDNEALAISVGRSEKPLERVPGMCGTLLTRGNDEAGRVERDRLCERVNDDSHHRHEVHGLHDGMDRVVNVAVRWTEVQWRDAERVLDYLRRPAEPSMIPSLTSVIVGAWFNM